MRRRFSCAYDKSKSDELLPVARRYSSLNVSYELRMLLDDDVIPVRTCTSLPLWED